MKEDSEDAPKAVRAKVLSTTPTRTDSMLYIIYGSFCIYIGTGRDLRKRSSDSFVSRMRWAQMTVYPVMRSRLSEDEYELLEAVMIQMARDRVASGPDSKFAIKNVKFRKTLGKMVKYDRNTVHTEAHHIINSLFHMLHEMVGENGSLSSKPVNGLQVCIWPGRIHLTGLMLAEYQMALSIRQALLQNHSQDALACPS